MTRSEAVRRCRDLMHRFARQGTRGQVGYDWAEQWANALLDTRAPVSLYAAWIAEQEARCDRIEQTLEITR